MKFVAILSLAVLLPCESSMCEQYVCDPSTAEWASDTICGMQDPVNDSQYDVRSCPSGQFCSGGIATGYVCASKPAVTPSMLPGEYCDYDTYTCLAGTCTNSKCPTLKSGDTCTYIQECGGNLTCSNGKCVTLATPSGACTLDTDCVQNAGCVSGICVTYISVASQADAPGCSAEEDELQQNPFCASGYCYQTATAGIYVCSDLLANSQPIPFNCIDGEAVCKSTKDSKSSLSLEGFCSCSYDGNEYCSQFPGDADFKSYTNYLAAFQASSTILTCNTLRNQGSAISYMNACSYAYSTPSDMERAAYYRAFAYSTLVNANKCVLKILASDYYYAEDDEDEDKDEDASTCLVLSGVLLAFMN